MKKLLLVVLIFLIFLSVSQTQANAKTTKTRYGVSFDFDALRLKKFNDYIGAKIWISKNVALLSKIKIYISDDVINGDNVDYHSKDNVFETGLKFGIERHFNLNQRFSPFAAAVAGFEYANQKDQDINYIDNQRFIHENKQHKYIYSSDINFGMECFIFKNLSFTGQHTITIYYHTGKSTYESVNEIYTRNINRKYIVSGTSALIVTVYF